MSMPSSSLCRARAFFEGSGENRPPSVDGLMQRAVGRLECRALALQATETGHLHRR
jgi:hypothetical protein